MIIRFPPVECIRGYIERQRSMGNIMNNKRYDTEKREIFRRVADSSVLECARELDVNTAHISNALIGGRRVGPTLRRAMIRAGWIPKPEPYRYFKIRRDDPVLAARQIVGRVDRGELDLEWIGKFMSVLLVELFPTVSRELANMKNDVEHELDRRGILAFMIRENQKTADHPHFRIIGNAEPVIIPGDQNEKNDSLV